MARVFEEMGDTVIVGGKPIMNYIVACITLFNAGRSQIKIRARGKNISKAVNVVEMLRRVFVKDMEIKKIEIGTDRLKDETGNERSLSTISITLQHVGESEE